MDLTARQINPGVVPYKVPYHTFLGTIWAGVAISGIVLACRLYSRFRGPRRLFWDDPFAIFAFILILVTGALWQWRAKDMYLFNHIQAGIAPYESDFFLIMKNWLATSLIVEIFFYTSLISIKLSFLFFFWRLGNGVNYFKYLWWPVLFLSLSSYFAAIGDINYPCLVGSVDFIISECAKSERKNASSIALKVNCALDVFTDFLIMLLPATLLWDIRMQWTKKIALSGLFSLSVITMIIAIVRAATIAVTKFPDGDDDASYLWLWSGIEPPVALIVSCLSAFPQLFAQSSHRKKPSFTPSQTYLKMISRIRARKEDKGRPWADLTNVSRTQELYHTCIGPDTEMSSVRTQNSREPVLVPQGSRPIVHAYTGSSNDTVVVPENQIKRQFEVCVTNQ
ncbi:hypothetical protein F4805DRAFT_473809 [Annulohypoxylon moriforme]|nr:hypothetical protein F4805DRAFT_473809 [Annulohypoxylon moriforme]